MKTTALHKLNNSEKECSLLEALNNPLMDDCRYMWVVAGQYCFSNLPSDYSDTTTYIARSIESPNRFSVGTILAGRPYIKERSFSEKELENTFPALFKLSGQMIRLG